MFTDSERQIFPYCDGARKVFGDPMELNRRLWHLAEGDLAGLLKRVRDPETPEPVSFEATTKFLGVVREAFDLVPFDRETGKGAASADCFAIYETFANFMDQKKSGAATSLTSPAASASREDSIMGASWPCGSKCQEP